MAVYTDVDDAALNAFLGQYAIGALTGYRGIAEGVENSNFLLETTQGRYILTLYEKRVKRDDLPFFLGLMDHLAAKGLACPTPIHRTDGTVLGELCGRPAAIVSFLAGVWPRRIALAHCAPVGEALASLHLAGQDFALKRANALGPAGWRPLVEACRARADTLEAGLADMIARELDYLDRHWPRDLPYGVIHADLFPDNVFFLDDAFSGMIDFYFACNDFLVYDLAICLNAWCFEADGAFNATKARHLAAGYRRKRALTQAELAALPIFARGSALRFLLTRLYDWLHHPPGAFVKPKDPLEYARKLRFHAGAAGLAAYGIETGETP
jgi:homoserine kinase type II